MHKYLLLIAKMAILALFCGGGAMAASQDLVEELLKSVQANDIPAVRGFISRGMSVDTADQAGNTLLMRASRDAQVDMVKLLVALKADPRRRNAAGDTPLMFAALGGNVEIVRLLLGLGSPIEHPGWTPMHYCAWAGKQEVCKFLIDQGADVDVQSPNGTTPLMMAVRGGHLETVKLLVWELADLTIRNHEGASALDWAKAAKRLDIVAHLNQAGARD